MNERIHELAKQCQMFNQIKRISWFDYEKFAQLIVGECAYIMDKDADHPFVSRGSILKHHFGVEE